METVKSLSKSEFIELLCLATKDFHFIFDGTVYKQIDCVAMGSPLSPTLANAINKYKQKQVPLERYPVEYRPFYYQSYVDDVCFI